MYHFSIWKRGVPLFKLKTTCNILYLQNRRITFFKLKTTCIFVPLTRCFVDKQCLRFFYGTLFWLSGAIVYDCFSCHVLRTYLNYFFFYSLLFYANSHKTKFATVYIYYKRFYYYFMTVKRRSPKTFWPYFSRLI